MPKDHIPGSPDTTKHPHNKTSRDCILRCRQDRQALDKICLKSQEFMLKLQTETITAFINPC